MTASAAVLRLPTGQTITLDDGPASIALCQRALQSSHLKFYDIAQRSGVCIETVSRLAYGDTKFPRMSTVVRILMALGWTIYASDDRRAKS